MEAPGNASRSGAEPACRAGFCTVSWFSTSLILGSGLEYHRRLDESRQEGEKLSSFAANRS